MRRLVVVLAAAGLLAALSFSHVATAAKKKPPPQKVKLCHITYAGLDDVTGAFIEEGHVIEVSTNAEAAHRAHGDYGGDPSIPGDVLGLGKAPGEYCSRP